MVVDDYSQDLRASADKQCSLPEPSCVLSLSGYPRFLAPDSNLAKYRSFGEPQHKLLSKWQVDCGPSLFFGGQNVQGSGSGNNTLEQKEIDQGSAVSRMSSTLAYLKSVSIELSCPK